MISRPRCSRGRDRPTAIFAASDTQALGVLAAAQDLGLHVPDDLSVIGYDDIEACDFVGLTTVRQHLFESGRQGAQLLMAEIVERAAPPPMVGHPTRDRPTTDDGAPEGGPPPRVTDRNPRPAGTQIDGGGLRCSAPTLTGRWPDAASFAVPAILVATLAILASACAPGASVTPSASTAPSTGPATPAASASAATAVRRRARRRCPDCGTDPVVLNAVLRDRLRSAVQAVRGVHEAVPERDLEDQPGPVRQPHQHDATAARGRQPARPDPAADDGLAGQGQPAEESRRLRTAFGWDKWPAAQLAQNRVGTDGTRGAGSLYAAGLNYSLTGVFYNKELATQIGMTEAAEDGRRVRGPACQGEGGRPSADHAVERRRQRRRTGLPAPAAHGRLRRDCADQRLDLPEVRAPRSTRRPT